MGRATRTGRISSCLCNDVMKVANDRPKHKKRGELRSLKFDLIISRSNTASSKSRKSTKQEEPKKKLILWSCVRVLQSGVVCGVWWVFGCGMWDVGCGMWGVGCGGGLWWCALLYIAC